MSIPLPARAGNARRHDPLVCGLDPFDREPACTGCRTEYADAEFARRRAAAAAEPHRIAHLNKLRALLALLTTWPAAARAGLTDDHQRERQRLLAAIGAAILTIAGDSTGGPL